MTIANRSIPISHRSRRRLRARESHRTTAHWNIGVIVDMRDDLFTVVSEQGSLEARVSFSCLVVPALGDTVSCLDAGANGAWIGSILARQARTGHATVAPLHLSTGPVTWNVEGGLAIAVKRFSVDAEEFHMATRSIDVTADRAHVVVEGLRFIAGAIKLIASTLSSAMTRVQHFSESYARSTTGLDRVSAGHVEVEAETLMHLKSQHTMVDGSKLVKARGGQIHFG